MTIGYNYLTEEQKRIFAKNLVLRRLAYVRFCNTGEIDSSKRILIIGDRPGPGAKNFDEAVHHNTPFYSKTFCSGWMNSLLVLNGISEDKLLWINSASFSGVETNSAILDKSWHKIIALGNNASNWCKKHDKDHIKINHPQYQKRFKINEPYCLIDILKAEL